MAEWIKFFAWIFVSGIIGAIIATMILFPIVNAYAAELPDIEESCGLTAESGWGEHMFRPNNIFGFGRMEFESIPKCIDYVSWYLRKHYLNENGKYYRGGTIDDIGKIWCPDGTGDWERLVSGIYGGLAHE